MHPFLSIIVPIYNVEKFVGSCLTSLIDSPLSPEDYEILVINDGSPDHSAEIVKNFIEHHPRHTIRCFDYENGGLSVARNRGLLKASGEYVWFVDSDDTINGEFLAGLLKRVQQERPDIAYFSFQFEYEQSYSGTHLSEVNNYEIEQTLSAEQFYSNHFSYLGCYAWAAWYSRKFLLEKGITFPVGIYFEDIVFMGMISNRAQKVFVYPYKVYNYHIHAQSFLREKNKEEERVRNKLVAGCLLFNDRDACLNIRIREKQLDAISSFIRHSFRRTAVLLDSETFYSIRHALFWEPYKLLNGLDREIEEKLKQVSPSALRSELFRNKSLKGRIMIRLPYYFPKLFLWLSRHVLPKSI